MGDVAESGSLQEPTIALGSAVVVQSLEAADLAAGDVMTFRVDSGALVTHRISEVLLDGDAIWFTTKGDNNATADPGMVAGVNVVGRVAFSVPLVGYIVFLFSMPSGLIFIGCLSLYVVLRTFFGPEEVVIRRTAGASPATDGAPGTEAPAASGAGETEGAA